MEFELEELKEELEEIKNELSYIKDFNVVGLKITHKKFGNGEIVSQNEFNAKIKFEDEERNLLLPFIFAKNLAESNDIDLMKKMQDIFELQERIKLLESEIRLKEKEIELNKSKNKIINVNLFAVTTGLSYDYILQTKMYCCKSYRCKQICEYLGLYKDKSIVKIAEINKIIEAEHVNGKLVTKLIKGKAITEQDILNIEEYIKKGFELFNCDIGSQKHKYFIVERFYDTDYKKVTNGGLMEHKYFDLYDRLGEEKMPDIETLADRLQDIDW